MVWVLIARDSNPDDSKIIFLNDMLIKLGIARAQTQYNYSQEMKDKFTQSEKEAREQKKRIWSQAL
jgi:endonuclease YncB( thermonuclease family)